MKSDLLFCVGHKKGKSMVKRTNLKQITLQKSELLFLPAFLSYLTVLQLTGSSSAATLSAALLIFDTGKGIRSVQLLPFLRQLPKSGDIYDNFFFLGGGTNSKTIYPHLLEPWTMLHYPKNDLILRIKSCVFWVAKGLSVDIQIIIGTVWGLCRKSCVFWGGKQF